MKAPLRNMRHALRQSVLQGCDKSSVVNNPTGRKRPAEK
ncbi:hypothetical protein JDS19_22405 [Escherichia coli]|nr:hypothetical protein [Escherichia coli]MCX0703128.1 hypothetical protein [Escherichia coli]